MKKLYYVGMDVHKKSIAYCIKKYDGTLIDEGTIKATREGIQTWIKTIKHPWIGAMEATMFTGWIYDFLLPHAYALKVAHPFMLKAIAASKKKNDQVDAGKIADLLRCDLLPECYMAPTKIRELRRILRYRNMVVREAIRMKNKIAGLLMELGVTYTKSKLHGKKYFEELLHRLDEVPDSVMQLLQLTRATLEQFRVNQKILLKALLQDQELKERVDRLTTIQGVGNVMALTWALETGEINRFPTIRKAISYCGLCSAQIESAGVSKRGPLSKQRNSHLQTMLIETAKLAPRYNPQLAQVYTQEKEKGANVNRATLAVARKLVAYLFAVDRDKRNFQIPKTN